MTETNLGSNFSWWVGKVVNVKDDPYLSGRVRVRIIGRHDDINNFPDDSLPWAMPMQPITSAAVGRIGTSPLGLLPGSHVLGMYADKDQQYPIVLGSFGKGGDADGGPIEDGAISIDYKNGGSIPSLSQSDDVLDNNAFNKLFLGRALTEKIYDSLTNNGGPNPSTPNTRGSNITKDVKAKLHKPDVPTTASVDPKDKGNVLDHIKQVDPQFRSTVLPNATTNVSSVRDIMQMASPKGINNLLQGSMTRAFSLLASSVGLSPTLSMLSGSLLSGAISGNYQSIIRSVMNGLLLSAAGNGGILPKIISPRANVITNNSPRPFINSIVSVIPPLYVQQYYSIENDPYPGYIQWKGQAGDFLYTLRNGEPNYSSPQQHITAHHGNLMGSGLGVIMNQGLTGVALGIALSTLMNGTKSSISDMGLSKIMGSGASVGNMLSLATKLLGGRGLNIQSFVGSMADSVLSSGFSSSMNNYAHKQSILAMKKKALNEVYNKTADQQDSEAIDAAKQYALAKLDSMPNLSSITESVPLSDGTAYQVKVSR